MAAALALARRRLAVPALPALAAALAVASALFPRGAANPATTYAAVSALGHATDLVAGMALVAGGLVAWTEPRTRPLGRLALSAGVVWFAADWEGWATGPAPARSIGAVALPFIPALLLHIALAAPTGRLGSRRARAATESAYALTAAFAIGRALLRNPVLDVHCWRNCLENNSFLVHADQPLVRALDVVWTRTALAIALAACASAAYRLARASAAARPPRTPVLLGTSLAGAAYAAYAIALLGDPGEDPRHAQFAALFGARAIALVLVGGGVAWCAVRDRRTRSAVTRLARDLGAAPPPGMLRNTLAHALGDDSLQVVYPLAGGRRFVDAHGRSVAAPAGGAGRAVTAVVRGREPVAIVDLDAALLALPELERELGAGAKLAIENERLQAEVLARLDELRASRARIVDRGDAERRRLERDLHDGAQQRLLALSYDLRVARGRAEAGGSAGLAATLDAAIADTQRALAELRELAQGIFPTALAEAGIAAALEALADASPVPLVLGDLTEERFEAPVEAAAYVTVVEALDEALARGATHAAVDVVRDDGHVVVAVRDDGTARHAELVHLRDRIGALGGELEIQPTGLRASIPCA